MHIKFLAKLNIVKTTPNVNIMFAKKMKTLKVQRLLYTEVKM